MKNNNNKNRQLKRDIKERKEGKKGRERHEGEMMVKVKMDEDGDERETEA